jgi:hypothetical protein
MRDSEPQLDFSGFLQGPQALLALFPKSPFQPLQLAQQSLSPRQSGVVTHRGK